MRLLGRVILGERADVPAVLLRALLGQEPEGSVAGSLKLTVRHGLGKAGQRRDKQTQDTRTPPRICDVWRVATERRRAER